MPCDSSYMNPRADESASRQVISFLEEAGYDAGKYDNLYGRTSTIDADTRKLCKWCVTHRGRISSLSLEFQIWWRDHQKEDARKQKELTRQNEQTRLRLQALSKLTPAERRALKGE